ncbi:signal recognition particle-docking protein FtsY [Candidatus Woesearchaeota archaeon]|nr:MAG: signal recognition particle-docking protein FtsY [Candidatus Woesearchaeota archaeon]
MFNSLRKQLGSVLGRFARRVSEEAEEKQLPLEEAEETIQESKEEVQEQGLRRRITRVFTKTKLSEEKFEQLFTEIELSLLQNNVASKVVDKIKEDLKAKLVDKPLPRRNIEQELRRCLRESLMDVLGFEVPDLVKMIGRKKPFVILFVGVNGSGKTTTIAKICKLFLDKGKKCVMVASDTFRAAAIQQLEEHARRLNVKVIKHDYGADPAAVAYDGVTYAKVHGIDVVLIDTAGRMHTNRNLMDELKKIKRVVSPDVVLYVGEAITGNDCIEQANQYDEGIGIDGIVLTKVDVDDKGGTALSIAYVTGKPIWLLGTGQNYEDVELFDGKKIIEGLGL